MYIFNYTYSRLPAAAKKEMLLFCSLSLLLLIAALPLLFAIFHAQVIINKRPVAPAARDVARLLLAVHTPQDVVKFCFVSFCFVLFCWGD